MFAIQSLYSAAYETEAAPPRPASLRQCATWPQLADQLNGCRWLISHANKHLAKPPSSCMPETPMPVPTPTLWRHLGHNGKFAYSIRYCFGRRGTWAPSSRPFTDTERTLRKPGSIAGYFVIMTSELGKFFLLDICRQKLISCPDRVAIEICHLAGCVLCA